MNEFVGETLEIDDEAIVFRGRIVGEFDGTTLSLNAGWCRLAGLAIRVEGDTNDRRRVLLQRPEPEKTRRPIRGTHPAHDPQQQELPVEDLPQDQADRPQPEQPQVPEGRVMAGFQGDDPMDDF